MSHKNAKQMIRTSAQLASHICSPIVNNTYVVVLFTPFQFGEIVMVAASSVEKEKDAFHPPWTFHFHLYPLERHLPLR